MTTPLRETFTIDLLGWTPWLERATETELSAERRAAIDAYFESVPHSDYIDVLANDFDALLARAKVHRHVYVESDDPRSGAPRELGATTASRINGCVFCASVHARWYAKYSGNRALAIQFLEDGIETDLPPLERAVVDLAAKLTVDPESFGPADLRPLRDLGFDDLAILDIINYTAFFANANRLMLTLGEPKQAERAR